MAEPAQFLAGGGSVGALMREKDWSFSPLGPPDSWPQSLRTVVGLLLQSRFPMFVAWGKDLGFLYNDPYAEILGAKHPAALGSRFHDIWSEIWSDISPLIDAAMAGQATFREDLPLVMNRKGYDEHTWFTFSYSPVRDESGQVAGMFCAVSETTQKVLAERGLRTNSVYAASTKRWSDASPKRSLKANCSQTLSKAWMPSFRYSTSTSGGLRSTAPPPTSSSESMAFARGSATAL
jgi:hypothetical protein